MEISPAARLAHKTLIDAGFIPSKAVTHSSAYRSWIKYENGNFKMHYFKDGTITVRAFTKNGNQVSIEKIKNCLEKNGFTVVTHTERYTKEVGFITI